MRIFSFVKKTFFLGLTVISNITGSLECISIKNQQCKVRPKIVDVSSNNLIFYPFSVKVNRLFIWELKMLMDILKKMV